MIKRGYDIHHNTKVVSGPSYDATKRECKAVVKALQKVRYWLYGTHFVLETDANVLVAQLNKAATDLPGVLVTQWLAFIHMFDFEVRPVPGRKHTVADGLSRYPKMESDDINEQNEEDIKDFLDTELAILSIAPISVVSKNSEKLENFGTPIQILNKSYSEESQRIARYLTTLRKPE